MLKFKTEDSYDFALCYQPKINPIRWERVWEKLRLVLIICALAFVFALRFDTQQSQAATLQQADPSQSSEVLSPNALAPLPNIVQFAAGSEHTCVLTTGGGVQCWGSNSYGQIGDGTQEVRTLPVTVFNSTTNPALGVKAIAAGMNQSCAVLTDGNVACWGGIDLYEGSVVVTRTVPTLIIGLNGGASEVVVGAQHGCALLITGAVQCWAITTDPYGYSNSDLVTDTTPVDIEGLSSDIQSITTGSDHLCALTTAGGVKCVGNNSYGQLGDGTTDSRRNAMDVAGLSSGVLDVRANADHTCALLNSGAVQCWGNNYSGQLGDGSTSSRSLPVNVVGLSSGIISVAAGGSHNCAVTNTGAAKCWGSNFSGQLGDSTTTRRSTPVDVITLNHNVTRLIAGGSHTCALLSSGAVKCWGSNGNGQLGIGVSSTRITPIDVVGLSSGIAMINAAGTASCAVTSGGGVKCWGENSSGQLGDGTTLNRPSPVDVIGINDVRKAVTSGSHSCALTNSGSVLCWGANYYGQLGDGTTTGHLQPAAVSGLNSGVIDIAVNYYHSCALLSSGTVQCWGYNGSGQVGDNSTLNRLTPVAVYGLSGVQAISLGSSHSCALLTNGVVNCWGYNGDGQLGNGSKTNSLIPVTSIGLDVGVSAISAGTYHTCAVLTTGALSCWGYNAYGQLGNDSFVSSSTAVAVSGLESGVSGVAANYYHTCAVTTAGVAKCWGANYYGELGDGTTLNHATPVDVVGLDGTLLAAGNTEVTEKALAIALGGAHSCVLTGTKGVKCWGANYAGQLGDSGSWRTIPDDVLTSCHVLTLAATGQGSTPTITPVNSLGCLANNFVAGEVIAVVAAPAANWQVAGWNGTISDGSTALTNTIIMPDGNHNASVSYSQGCYTLTRSHSGAGSDPLATPANSPTCPAGQYVFGQAINLSATPAVGWASKSWLGTANDSSTSTTNSLQMPAHNHTVSIAYTQPCYALTLLHNGAGSDPVASPTNSPTCSAGKYVSSQSITLTAAPASGWVISGWSGVANSTAVSNTLLMPMADQTVNVSYSKLPDTPAPSGSDAYEDDDTCLTAHAITSDGVAQERTFHKAGDTDWVRFDSTSGVIYRIEVQVPITAPTDVNLEIYEQCQSAASGGFSASFSPGVRLDFTAQNTGSIYLRLSDNNPTLAGPQVAYRLSVRRMQSESNNPGTPSKGVLVLLAGRLKNPDAVQKNINAVTQAVYDLYKSNGYSDDDIQYLTTDPSMPGYDKPATLANLQEAIVTWAKGKLSADRQLTLYLMDHGDSEKFFVDGSIQPQQVLTPTLLGDWLGQIESAVPGVKVTVIIEACYSGSFIKSVQRISKPGRLIIASTSADTVAYASTSGAYFSDQFVTSLRQGYSLHNSFRAAYAVSLELTRLLQEPWLDGNGNGIPNEPEDVALASKRGLGYAEKNTSDSWAPFIASAQGPNQIVDRRGAIVAEVRDNKRVRRVWAVIYPPSYRPPTNSKELVPENLPMIILPAQGKDNFGSEYPGFDETGVYRIAIYAEDDDGLTSLPKVISVQNGKQVFLPLIAR